MCVTCRRNPQATIANFWKPQGRNYTIKDMNPGEFKYQLQLGLQQPLSYPNGRVVVDAVEGLSCLSSQMTGLDPTRGSPQKMRFGIIGSLLPARGAVLAYLLGESFTSA